MKNLNFHTTPSSNGFIGDTIAITDFSPYAWFLWAKALILGNLTNPSRQRDGNICKKIQ
jgi:hypothetical protein